MTFRIFCRVFAIFWKFLLTGKLYYPCCWTIEGVRLLQWNLILIFFIHIFWFFFSRICFCSRGVFFCWIIFFIDFFCFECFTVLFLTIIFNYLRSFILSKRKTIFFYIYLTFMHFTSISTFFRFFLRNYVVQYLLLRFRERTRLIWIIVK